MLNLDDGLTTMAAGMGTVFAFLIILWFAVAVMGNVVKKLNEIFPEPVAAVKTAVKKAVGEADIAIAIAMAKLRG